MHLRRITILAVTLQLAACSWLRTEPVGPWHPPTTAASVSAIAALHEARTADDPAVLERFCQSSPAACPPDLGSDHWAVADGPIEVLCTFTFPVPPDESVAGLRVVVVESTLESGEEVVGQVVTHARPDGEVFVSEDYGRGLLVTRVSTSGSRMGITEQSSNPVLPGQEEGRRRIRESCEDPHGFAVEVLDGGPPHRTTVTVESRRSRAR